jgi:hypothetical protein
MMPDGGGAATMVELRYMALGGAAGAMIVAMIVLLKLI